MSTMNISLPDALKSFVDEQVIQHGYGTSREYVRELIRKDRDRLQLRGLLLAGAAWSQRQPPMAATSKACGIGFARPPSPQPRLEVQTHRPA